MKTKIKSIKDYLEKLDINVTYNDNPSEEEIKRIQKVIKQNKYMFKK